MTIQHEVHNGDHPVGVDISPLPSENNAVKQKPKNQLVDIYKKSISAEEADPTWAVDLRWAHDVIKGSRGSPPASLRPDVAAALVEVLVDSVDGETLAYLAGSESKKLAKASRAGLHRLRSRKVAVDVPRQATGSAGTGIGESKVPDSVITAYDGHGQRLVWLADSAPKGLMLAQARLSARFGLVDFDLGDLSRKAYRELVKQLQEKFTAPWVDAQIARWYLFDGVARCEAAGRSLPQPFLRYSGELGSAPGGEHPALAIEPLQDDRDLLQLYQQPELAAWLPDTDELRRLILQRQEIATSQLYVNEQQRREQIEYRTVRWLQGYFTPERILADRTFLLDMAHLLQLQQREHLAGAARAAADLFQQPAEELAAQPFIREFIERLLPDEDRLGEDEEQAEEKRTEGGLIIP